MSNPDPAIDRPKMPDGYGVPSDDAALLGWAEVERRLVESAVYWLATTRPDGRPHVVPRWGVWLDGAFWYDGSPQTRHVRNLLANEACTLHLEDGTHAVIVEGTAGPTTDDPTRTHTRETPLDGLRQVQGAGLFTGSRLVGRRARRRTLPVGSGHSTGLAPLPRRCHPFSLVVITSGGCAPRSQLTNTRTPL